MSMDIDDYQTSAEHGIMETMDESVNKENEDFNIDVERVLHDVLHIVCRYVHGKDLNNMARVSKSWRYAVQREKDKRYYIQCLRLPNKTDNLADTLLDVNPSVSVLIYDDSATEKFLSPSLLNGRSSEYPNDDLEEDMSDLKKQPKKTIVALKVDEFFYTEDDAAESPGEQAADHCNLFGLFIPNLERRFRVRAARIQLNNYSTRGQSDSYSYTELDAFSEVVNKQLDDQLGLNDCEHPNSTVLFLGSFYKFPVLDFTMRNCIFGLCKRAQQNGKKVTLASFFGTKIVQASENCYIANSMKRRQLAVVLNISGPSVESWSTFIFCYAPHEEIERKLQQLKERIKPKRYCTGLISSAKCGHPRCRHINHPSGNSHEMMDRLKRIFPGVPFVATFAKTKYWKRPNMNLNDLDMLNENDVTHKFCFDRYVSIVIISHD